MIFNFFLYNIRLFLVILFSFFIIFFFRRLLISHKLHIFSYYAVLFLCLTFVSIIGGSVQNDDYARFERFLVLEKNNQLESARSNPEYQDKMLKIDLQEFKNSNEFKNYLKENDDRIDIAEALFMGCLFAVIADLAMLIVRLILERKL
jgi:hypothetical protein